MCARSDHGRFRFEFASDVHKDAASSRIVPAIAEIAEDPSRAFDPVQTFDLQTGLRNFIPQFLRLMEICCREIIQPIGRILMMPVAEISLNDGGEILVEQ